MAPRRTLIRGGHVLTMDRALGDFPRADVLVEDDRIVAVAARLDVDDAEVIDAAGHIVAPGMIDTHRHTWQTQLRALCADWTLVDYYLGVRLSISPVYSPDDVHLGNRLGALEALNAGVTTILDFSHCNNTPEHADAAVAGLRDAGVRAVFGYGFFESSPQAPPHFATHAQRVEDFARIADRYFASSSGLLTLGVALSETVAPADVAAEIRAARSRNAVVVCHTGCVWAMPSGITELDEAGLLGPEQVHVHCNTLRDDEWVRLARAGAKVSISPETELNMGMGRPVFAACERHGIKPTLSCDVISLNSGDLLTQLRMAVAFKRWADTEGMNLAGQDPIYVTVTAADALEWVTINGAEAIGQGGRIGSLTPGKQADIIIVGGPGIAQHPRVDAAGTLVFQTTPSDVRTVLVAGHVVKRDGVLCGVDVAGLLQRADASAEAVLGRARDRAGELPPMRGTGFGVIAAAIRG
ncbi:MAG TPA: amidohydrolase family protein [Candidatus Limnocylindrales bacterium]|nr:amidohydrolase family protein [Candidatus Limnocylindrales bacterium]